MKELDSYQNKAPGDGGVKTGWEGLESLNNNTSQTTWEDLAALGNKAPDDKDTKITDLPHTSEDRTCRFYLKAIERGGRMDDVKDFLNSALDRDYEDMGPESLDQFCEAYNDETATALSPEEKSALKNYSGYNYKYINQVARGQWDYETLGAQTPENLEKARQSIRDLSEAISSAPAPETDLIAHRGTNLDSFRSYGIHSVSELANLKDQFFLESGFTSTSLDRSQSFAGQEDFDDPLRRASNVSIEYLIPAETDEVAGLFSSETSYSPTQRELLIDKGSLSYVSKVDISPDQSSAKLQMVLIPRSTYDRPEKP